MTKSSEKPHSRGLNLNLTSVAEVNEVSQPQGKDAATAAVSIHWPYAAKAQASGPDKKLVASSELVEKKSLN